MYWLDLRLKGAENMLHFTVSPDDDDPPKET